VGGLGAWGFLAYFSGEILKVKQILSPDLSEELAHIHCLSAARGDQESSVTAILHPIMVPSAPLPGSEESRTQHLKAH
jgi:hypothetical protein